MLVLCVLSLKFLTHYVFHVASISTDIVLLALGVELILVYDF